MKFSIKDFFSKRDQIRSFLRIWPHSLNKSLIQNFIFCAVEAYRSQMGQAYLHHKQNSNLAPTAYFWYDKKARI